MQGPLEYTLRVELFFRNLRSERASAREPLIICEYFEDFCSDFGRGATFDNARCQAIRNHFPDTAHVGCYNRTTRGLGFNEDIWSSFKPGSHQEYIEQGVECRQICHSVEKGKPL